MFRLGVLLIMLSFLPWMAIPIVPFLPIFNSVTERVSAVAGLCILAETVFWAGLLFAGRDTWNVVKLHGWKNAPKKVIELLRMGKT